MPETIERDKMKVTINPDKDIVEEIRSAIKECEGHCPCALEWTADTKCMCKKFRDQIEQGIEGECHCGLYILTKD